MRVPSSVGPVALFVLFAVLPAVAQERPPLSSASAVTEALRANAVLQAARVEAGVAFEKVPQERFLMPPMVEAQIWQWPLTSANPADVDMYMFTVEQAYPGRGKRAAREALARRQAEEGQAGVPVAERELALAVRVAWADLASARRVRAVYERALATLTSLGEASTVRYAAAAGGQQDVLRSIVEIAGVRRELIGVDERARLAEVRLATLLGRSPGARIEPLGDPVPLRVGLDVERLTEDAVTSRPELAERDAERARIAAALEVIAADRRPDWVVGGGYMLTPGEPGAWTARAGLTWPGAPWAKGRYDAQRREQEAALRAVEAGRAAAVQQIAAGVHEAAVALDAARARLALVREAVRPQAAQALEVSRIGYQAGSGTFIDVLDSVRTVLGVEIGLVEAEAEVWRAEAALERAVGAPLVARPSMAAAGERE
jgi:outer membrane protein TolC